VLSSTAPKKRWAVGSVALVAKNSKRSAVLGLLLMTPAKAVWLLPLASI
jgi:hypothetical protein